MKCKKSLFAVPEELGIIKKETFNNWYKLRTYYLATLITSTPIQVIYIVFVFLKISSPLFFLSIDNNGFHIYNDNIYNDRSAMGIGSFCKIRFNQYGIDYVCRWYGNSIGYTPNSGCKFIDSYS